MDSFYVLYVLTTGLVDDTQQLIASLREQNIVWKSLPIQI